MRFDFPHSLDLNDARERIGKLCSYLFHRHGIEVAWDGTSGTVSGRYLMVTIQGKMEISPAIVQFNGTDPGLMWRKKAITYLKEKLEIYLDPNTSVADLPIMS